MHRTIKPKIKSARTRFIRSTVTIPAELVGFIGRRVGDPVHAGNLSSYIRSLIIHDREQQQKEAA